LVTESQRVTAKEPVLLVVLLETAARRWSVAGIPLDGTALPLMQSEAGNLDPYLTVPLDEQVSFLRHRLSGVLQRGCDRLWGRGKKPCQIVFLADGPFAQAPEELMTRVAEHFVEWMTNPPVVFFTSTAPFTPGPQAVLQAVAGELEPARRTALNAALPGLFTALGQASLWELSPTKSQ